MRPGRWWAVAATLLLAGVGSLVLGLHAQRSLPPPPAAATRPVPPAAAVRSAAPAARSSPVTLRIPAIGLDVPVSQVGLNPDDTIQLPDSFTEPAWYRLGPSPGQAGSAVILGHVDSYRGPAVFSRLRSLLPGDVVEVTLADGVIVQFAVRSVAEYLKTDFPDRLVYSSHGYSGLQLVTCGGVFDTVTRHYLSNIVVYTRLLPGPGLRVP
jgi:LPXTG-site transpeptidase (sortase) family protein